MKDYTKENANMKNQIEQNWASSDYNIFVIMNQLKVHNDTQ